MRLTEKGNNTPDWDRRRRVPRQRAPEGFWVAVLMLVVLAAVLLPELV